MTQDDYNIFVHISISRLFLNIMHIFTSPTLHFTSTKGLVDWSLAKPMFVRLSSMLFVFQAVGSLHSAGNLGRRLSPVAECYGWKGTSKYFIHQIEPVVQIAIERTSIVT